MSHIFDALQKSALEQAEIEIPSAAAAAELLEAAERRTAAARAKTAVLDEPMSEGEATVLSVLKSAVEPAPVIPIASRLVASEAPVKPVGFDPFSQDQFRQDQFRQDQFSQFQNLNVLVPPQSRVVCVTDKESLAAEKFRFLAVRLRQMQQNRPLKKVLVTSTIPQEGKSMTAANLACALARRTNQKTLLVDGDLRRPSVARLFGLGKISGISEWLQGEGGPISSIYHLEDAGLWVLPAGNIPRNPLELLQSGKLAALMEQLTSWFDWIVIDTPPVLPLADTSIWMRMSDGVMLVARQGTTERDQLKRGIEAIEPSKLLGALLNGSTNTKKSDYYYQPVIEA